MLCSRRGALAGGCDLGCYCTANAAAAATVSTVAAATAAAAAAAAAAALPALPLPRRGFLRLHNHLETKMSVLKAMILVQVLGSSALVTPRVSLRRPKALCATAGQGSDVVSRRTAFNAALLSAAVVASGEEPALAVSYLEAQVRDLDKKSTERNNNGAPEKHIPELRLEKAYGNSGKELSNYVTVKVSANHVMDAEKPHFIKFMWLRDNASGEIITVKEFQPSDQLSLTLKSHQVLGKSVTPLLFCNLHGLWEGQPTKVAAV